MEILTEWLKGLLITALIFVPLERMLALRVKQHVFRAGWLNDLIYYMVNGQIINLALVAFVAGTIVIAGWWMPAFVQAAVAQQPIWLQFIEIVLLSDLGFYFTHRAFHTVPFLWRFHAIHHSIEELDWLAGARIHPLDQIVTKGVSFLPVFSLGFSDVAIGASLVVFGWHALFLHSNVRLKFGPLRWLLATPEFHHWHHSKDRQVRDKNFAGQLPLLDVLFGTLHMPRGVMPSAYGIDEPIPATYPAQLLHPFRSAPAVEKRDEAFTLEAEATIASPHRIV